MQSLPLRLFILVLVLGLLLAFIQIGLLTIAFEKLGLSPNSGALLLFSALFGSMLNLPVVRVSAEAPPEPPPEIRYGRMPGPVVPFTGSTVIAVNVGGCVIPILFSLYLMRVTPVPLLDLAQATLVVALVSYLFSRPVVHLGIAMPIFIAPATAAAAAVLIDGHHTAQLAYVSGTCGVLIGADLMRLKDVRKLGAPIAAIGGAGTFDGIFMTGIVAALLA
jgi:uncharacterized membrane protein